MSKIRTPFDDPDQSGHDVPDSKRTQPLPSPHTTRRVGGVLGGLQNPAATPASSSPPPVSVAPPANVAPPVVNVDDDDYDATLTSRLPVSGRKPKWLPLPTLIGLTAAGGALLVVLVPALMRRVIPTVPMKSMPAPTTPTSNSVVMVPPDATGNVVVEEVAPATEDAGISQPQVPRSQAPAANPPVEAPRDSTPRTSAPSTSLPVEESESDGEKSVNEEAPSSRETPREPSRSTSYPETSSSTTSGDNFVNRREGYAIAPPAGFSLSRTGRRTTWKGPRGSQLLVETSPSVNGSPREGWEKLDKALARKYGSRYQSFGIRETTMAGRPAAVWEFQIGDTRKIDIAVHDKGRGYAVLGSAPSGRFEEVRPHLESAISSFELRERERARRRRSTREREKSDDEERTPARRERVDEVPSGDVYPGESGGAY
jgi:hypothetical protein